MRGIRLLRQRPIILPKELRWFRSRTLASWECCSTRPGGRP